jgi:hypothetical protein
VRARAANAPRCGRGAPFGPQSKRPERSRARTRLAPGGYRKTDRESCKRLAMAAASSAMASCWTAVSGPLRPLPVLTGADRRPPMAVGSRSTPPRQHRTRPRRHLPVTSAPGTGATSPAAPGGSTAADTADRALLPACARTAHPYRVIIARMNKADNQVALWMFEISLTAKVSCATMKRLNTCRAASNSPFLPARRV